jgi:glyoxylase-like metal-dependent hydrolase (beta-lactamase superfamily II)
MDRFRIGNIVVHRIEEWQGSFAPPDMLFQGYEARDWAPHEREFVPDYFNPGEGKLYAFLQSWVLDTGTQRILFDTGAGNDKDRPGIPVFGNLDTDFLSRLRRAGFAPEDIDIVVCSHIHIDHVGWNTQLVEGRWHPTFRNARYVLPRDDHEYWDPADMRRGPGEVGRIVNAGMFEDSVQPLIDAGRVEWAEDGFEIAPGLSLHSVPGHTPGSMMMRVSSADRRAMFVGDIVHHPMQIYQPGWNSAYCEDQDQARLSRRRVLTEAADTGALLIPAHFGGHHVVQVAREGTAFRPLYTGESWK